MTAFLLFLILIVLLHVDFMMSRMGKPKDKPPKLDRKSWFPE